MDRRAEFLVHFPHDCFEVGLAKFDTATDQAVVAERVSIVGRLRLTAWAVKASFGATSIALTRMQDLSTDTRRAQWEGRPSSQRSTRRACPLLKSVSE